MKKNVIVVDGYSTGKALSRELRLLGASVFHLRSNENEMCRLSGSLDVSLYSGDLGYQGSARDVSDLVRSYNPVSIVAGSEPGVEYAEALCHQLSLRGNRVDDPCPRRNKYQMMKVLESSGLSSTRQAVINNQESAINWCLAHGSFPVVVKPLDSAGSDGVTVCHDFDQVKKACSRALGGVNLFGFKNHDLLIQSFIEGDQYIVNTVSMDGVHVLTDMWKMNLRPVAGRANAMLEWEFVNSTEPVFDDLKAYVFKVNDALGIINSPGVAEVRLTAQGPTLVESGARLNGPTMEREAYFAAGLPGSQATAAAYAMLLPDVFKRLWCNEDSFGRGIWFGKSFFTFKGDGVVKSREGLSLLSAFKSYYAIYNEIYPGARVSLTADTVGFGGAVYWIAPTKERLQEDMREFREMDDAGRFYGVDYD